MDAPQEASPAGGISVVPCPWCAGPAWLIEDRGDHGGEPLLHRPQCIRCGGGLGGFNTRAEAIAAWNTRAADNTDAERIAQLEGALKKFTLFRNPDEEIAHYAGLCVDAAEEIGRELLHEDLCRLSVVFGRGSDLRDDRDRRINERLKAMIALAQAVA